MCRSEDPEQPKKTQKKWKRKPILGGLFLVINISKGLNLKYIIKKIRSSLFLKSNNPLDEMVNKTFTC